ncbi:MAG: hypothetical protein LUF30_12880 [Lachnospiraceae bacterium]|nr:hypothetical protein [Lachnospiraceae bacterium]
MTLLFVSGLELIIGGVLFIVCTIAGLFVGHIILFDSIALDIAYKSKSNYYDKLLNQGEKNND